MILYHYSKELYPELLTKAESGGMTPIQIKLARQESRRKGYFDLPYCDHISFFFEPIPSKLLSELFTGHPVWFKGNTLYEYLVDVNKLPLEIPYHVVESIKKTALYDKFSIEKNWVDDDPKLLEEWQILEDQKAREWGEKRNTRAELIKQIAANQGIIEDAYRAAVAREDFEWNKMKYAANVPHLMLYPPTGRVTPSKIRALTIGYDRRRDVISSNAF